MSTPTTLKKPEAGASILPQRVLGKTGELVPVLGMDTGPGGIGMQDDEAVALYERAIDLGVTYMDTAPGYGRAHTQLGEIVRRRRREIFLATKTPTSSADEALRMLEQNLQDLQTSQVDLAYVHSLGNQDVEQVLGPDGALEGLRRAQSQGLTRYVGFTAHNAPWKAATLLRQAEVDVVMLALNIGDRHTYNFEAEVLPLARAQNAGVAAMKVYGGVQGMDYNSPKPSALGAHGPHDHQQALRYALGLSGVDLAVIGMFSEAELNQNISWVQNHTPLTTEEEQTLEPLGRELAAAWGPHYGPVS